MLHSVTIQKTVTSAILCSVHAKASSQSTYDTWNSSHFSLFYTLKYAVTLSKSNIHSNECLEVELPEHIIKQV